MILSEFQYRLRIQGKYKKKKKFPLLRLMTIIRMCFLTSFQSRQQSGRQEDIQGEKCLIYDMLLIKNNIHLRKI